MKTLAFRYIKQIDEANENELKKLGYYKGFPCVYGHDIRDVQYHWCYHCVRKIQTNICGFDVNYLHKYYKVRYQELWNCIQINNFDKCWEGRFNSSRKNFPSYRTHTSARWSENVSIHKLIYQCAWGDVGKNFVTRTCGNPNCFNPLHLKSSWNTSDPPKIINPFDTKFMYEKLMLAGKRDIENLSVDLLMHRQYKNVIPHPKSHEYKNLEE